MAVAQLWCGLRQRPSQWFGSGAGVGPAWRGARHGQPEGAPREPGSPRPAWPADTAVQGPSFSCKTGRSRPLGSGARVLLGTLRGWLLAKCTEHPSFHWEREE